MSKDPKQSQRATLRHDNGVELYFMSVGQYFSSPPKIKEWLKNKLQNYLLELAIKPHADSFDFSVSTTHVGTWHKNNLPIIIEMYCETMKFQPVLPRSNKPLRNNAVARKGE